jgi:Bcr/CflA subfamily drug resistance transporter
LAHFYFPDTSVATARKMKHNPSKLFLALLAALPSIYAVLFTPSLPSLVTYFDVQFAQSQLPMSSFLLGYAFGQLPYGPLSNRFGRKPILALGILIALVSCLLCVVAGYTHNFTLFVIARFFMAVGSCAGLNIAFTIVGDRFDKTLALRIFSFIMLFSAVIPGMATCIGGFLTQYLGWQSCFYFLMLFGAALLAICWKVLPETAVAVDVKALRIKEILKSYAEECKNRQLILSALITGCGASIIYLFASAAPFIGIDLIGMNPDQYGTWAIFPSIGLAAGSFFTDRIAGRISAKQLLWIGARILIIASLLSFGSFYFGHIHPWSLFFPMLCIDTGLAFVFSTTATIALTQAKNKSIGSSLMHFINLGLCVVFINLIGLTSIKNPVILPLLFLLLVTIICLLLHLLVKSLANEELQDSM